MCQPAEELCQGHLMTHHEMCTQSSSSAAAGHQHGCLVGAAHCVAALIALELLGGAEGLGCVSWALQVQRM